MKRNPILPFEMWFKRNVLNIYFYSELQAWQRAAIKQALRQSFLLGKTMGRRFERESVKNR